MNTLNNIDLTEKEELLVFERFSELKEERTKYVPRWRDVKDYVALTNEINSEFEDLENKQKQEDIYINDPTGFICTNQAGDYLAGILWNLNGVTLEVSDYIKRISKGEDFSDFYKRATETTLEQINSTDAGFQSILKSYCYDQFSYATSGIGVFRSKEFDNGQSECCLTFKPYGVYNSCIDEGANNKVNVIYTVYNWRLNKIIEEFCIIDGEFSEEAFKTLPENMQRAYEAKKLNQKFKLVYGVMPNNFYKTGKRGKIGAKFKGYWFEEVSKKVFKVDYYKEKPIAICRFIRVNGKVYGESSGTLSISSIKILNHIMGDTVDNIEKATDTPLGMFSGSLVAGNVINRSAGSVTTFNPQGTANGQTPIFPIQQVGDISAVISFLIPEMKKTITNIFKIDQLLDFNQSTQMTATESSYRMSIRGKSINGILSQQKAECIEPTINRVISIIQECDLYGHSLNDMPEQTPEEIAEKQRVEQEGDFIPPVIAQAMKDGKKWYKLKFNGELEKLSNAQIYEDIGRFFQYIIQLLQIKPELVHALEDYELLDLIKLVSNLSNSNIIKSKTKYQELLQAIEDAKRQEQEQQNAILQAQLAKNISGANRDNAIANAQGGII